MRRFTLLSLNIVTWVLIGVMGTDESNLLSLSDVSTETQNKMPKLPIESPQPTNGNTMVGELADEGTLDTMDPTSTADDEMGSKQSSHSGTGASMSGPSRVVGSKVDELLSMNDDKLVEVPHDLLLSLIRSHLAQSAIKDASTAKRGVVEDKAEDSPMTADAHAEQIVAKENEVRTLRALLLALRKEYNQLLEQQWDDEQERKRKEEENKWLQQWDDTSNNLQDSIQDLSYNAALVEAAATEEQYERADRAGFIMIIVAGSIAVALVIIGVVVFALYADRRKAEEASTYELHQSLNDSAA